MTPRTGSASSQWYLANPLYNSFNSLETLASSKKTYYFNGIAPIHVEATFNCLLLHVTP